MGYWLYGDIEMCHSNDQKLSIFGSLNWLMAYFRTDLQEMTDHRVIR